MPPKPRPIAERFWPKINKDGANGCWEWTGGRTVAGYGQIGLPPHKTLMAHRVSWEIHNGPISAGLFVCHKCDNPPCVNPDHLFLGTNKDNTMDAWEKGRLPSPPPQRGTQNSHAKLTEEQVRDIRALRRNRVLKVDDVAELFLIGRGQVMSIALGQSWKHVR